MTIPKLTKALMALSMIFIGMYTHAQVTTATISGTITNKEGKPLPGATVKISYTNA